MMPGPPVLAFLAAFLWVLLLRQERIPQRIKVGAFYGGGVVIVVFSGLPSDAMAMGSGLLAARSLVIASIPMALGMGFYVWSFDRSGRRIPFFSMAYGAVVMIAFVYLVNWTLLAGLFRWSPVRSAWLVLYMEAFIRMSGLYLAVWAYVRAFGREKDSIYPGIVVLYLTVYLFFQGLQSGASRGGFLIFSYSLGAIIVGMWIFKAPPRMGEYRWMAPFLNGVLLALCSGIQAGLDFVFLVSRPQTLFVFVMVLTLIHLVIPSIATKAGL